MSSAGVPSAMTRPWSTTTMSRARRSASSRYCVVSSTVVPSRDQLLDDRPQVLAALGVEPGGGLVEEEHRRAGHQGGGQVEAPAHAARVGLERRGRRHRSGRSPRAARRPARPTRVRLRWESRPTMRMFSRPVRFSSTAAYWPASPMIRRTASGSATTSWPRTAAVPAVGAEDGGQDAHDRGLAGPVGAEQPEHGARPRPRARRRRGPARCRGGRPSRGRGPRPARSERERISHQQRNLVIKLLTCQDNGRGSELAQQLRTEIMGYFGAASDFDERPGQEAEAEQDRHALPRPDRPPRPA